MEDTTSQDAAAAAAEQERQRPPSALALRSLADYATGAIPTLFYVPDFISHSEQSQLLHNVLHPPNPVSFYSFAFFPLCFSRSYCIWRGGGDFFDADLPGTGAQVENPQEPEATELGYSLFSWHLVVLA